MSSTPNIDNSTAGSTDISTHSAAPGDTGVADHSTDHPAEQDHPQQVHVDVEVSRLRIPSVILATMGVLAVLFMAWVIYKTLNLLLIVFIALLVATAIEPVVNWLRRGPFNRSAGILVVYTGIFVVIAIIGYITLPVIFEQVGALGSSITKTANQLGDTAKTIQNPFLRDQLNTLVNTLHSIIGQSAAPPPVSGPGTTATPEQVQTATQTALTVAEIFFGIITIFVVAFYWLTERILIKRAVMSWLPARRANRVRRVWDDIEVKVGGWVRGQLTLMVLVGALSAVGYLVMGIQFWPALALFIAIAEAIPLVGPYLGTAPAVLVALTQVPDGGAGKALMVVAFAVILQTVEGNVLVPRVMKNSVGISPLTVIASILFGSALAGLAGALIAVPIAGSLQVVISDLKAAHESAAKLEEVTQASADTRAHEGELVVATPSGPAGHDTKTRVEADAKA